MRYAALRSSRVLSLLACATPVLAQAPAIAPPKLGGYIQARGIAQKNVGLTSVLNRARFSIDGSLPARFSYRFLVELEASAGARAPATPSLREAVAKWSPTPFAITAGQFKTPFSREYLLPIPILETADFAAVIDSLAPKYDVGVMGEYAIGPYATASLGVFNGEGQNATANRDSTGMWVARLIGRPIAQVGLGANATRDGDDSLRWGVEANVEEYGGVVRAEYITKHRRNRARNQDDFGWYVFGGYRVLPWIQAIGRVEDFQRPAYGISRRVRATTIGANFEISPNRVKLLMEWIRRATGANQANVDAVIGQLQVRF